MAKPQTKKTFRIRRGAQPSPYDRSVDLRRACSTARIGGPKPRGEAFFGRGRWCTSKLLEACDVLGGELHGTAQSVLFNNPGLTDNATTHTLA